VTERTWTDAQERVIARAKGGLIVTAGAGSGKTSSLVERVVRRVVHDGVDIDRILVVTFTEAAAQEMQIRIRARLQDAVRVQGRTEVLQQLQRMDRATISTIDSFCMQIVRKSALHGAVAPGFAIPDDASLAALARLAMDDALESLYSEADPVFVEYADAYSNPGGDAALRAQARSVYAFVRTQPAMLGWFQTMVEQLEADAHLPGSRMSYFKALCAHVVHQVGTALDALAAAGAVASEALEYAVAQHLAGEWERMSELSVLARAGRLSAVHASAADIFARMPSSKLADASAKIQWTALRNEAKAVISALTAGPIGRDELSWQAELSMDARRMRGLQKLVEAYHETFARRKRERGWIDFADLEHLAWQALDADQAGVRRELREQFAEVIVDEYQDTNPLQDAIIAAVAHPHGTNACYLGDVKQSIYAFRQAEPQLFLDRLTRYNDALSTDLASVAFVENFRSRPHIVSAVNELFSHIFVPELSGIVYDSSQAMTAAADYVDTEQHRVEVCLIETNTDALEPVEDPPSAESADAAQEVRERAFLREARVVARRIGRLLAAGEQIVDPVSGQRRALGPGDVAVLLRSRVGKASLMLRALREAGIPAQGEEDASAFDGYELRLARALLEVLDNPQHDIALASVLRSPLVGLTTTDLARLRVQASGPFWSAVQALVRSGAATSLPERRLRDWWQRLQSWRTAARGLGLGEAVEHVFRESGLFDLCATLPGAGRLENVRALALSAYAFAASGRGGLVHLREFISALDDAQTDGVDVQSSRTTGLGSDAVAVMTIHQSKGLEFPVVIVPDLGRHLRPAPRDRRLLLHRTGGVGAEHVDLSAGIRYNTVATDATAYLLLRDQLAEEARILYVACTRARERLFLFASLSDVGRQLSAATRGVGGGASVLRAKRPADWLLSAVARAQARQVDVFTLVRADTGTDRDAATRTGASVAADTAVDWSAVARLEPGALGDTAAQDEAAHALAQSLRTRPVASASVPAKLSVTAWERERLALRDGGESLSIAGRSRRRRHRGAPGDAPERTDGARYGTLFHAVMQALPLTPALTDRVAVAQAVARLPVAQGIGAATRETLITHVHALFCSSLGQWLIAERARVRREVALTMAVPAEAVAASLGVAAAARVCGEQVLLQGVADCVVALEDRVVLIDYKTDRVGGSADVVAQKYVGQLALYRHALERATGRPVERAWLFFVQAAVAVAVEPRAMADAVSDVLALAADTLAQADELSTWGRE